MRKHLTVCKRKSFAWAPSIKAGDKGATRRYKKEIVRELAGIDISSMAIKDIIDLAVNTSRKIGKARRRSPDGWSPTARCLEIKMGCLGTAIIFFLKRRSELSLKNSTRRDF